MNRFRLQAVATIGIVLLGAGCASKGGAPAVRDAAAATAPAASSARAVGMPAPDPSLKQLDKFVGTWSMKGRMAGSDKEDITGKAAFHWLEGGFFMQQDVEMIFAGTTRIKSLELIGYDPGTGALTSSVYSNLSPVPLPYKWNVQGDTLTISVSYGQLDATFKGTFSEDGRSFSGSWQPNPGADPKVNVAYDIGATRVQ